MSRPRQDETKDQMVDLWDGATDRRGVIQADAKVRRGSTQAEAAGIAAVDAASHCGREPAPDAGARRSYASPRTVTRGTHRNRLPPEAAVALPRSTAPKGAGLSHNIFYAHAKRWQGTSGEAPVVA